MKKFFLILFSVSLLFKSIGQTKIFVATNGNDENAGTVSRPLQSMQAAVLRALTYNAKDVVIGIRAGTYPLDSTIEINANGFSLKSLSIQAYANEKVVVTGSKKIVCDWKPFKNGILKAILDIKVAPDQLFLNGDNLHMARYPNYDASARVFNGTAADALSDERVKSWHNPTGGFIHALHEGEWGGFHYRITGKDENGRLTMEGGWQNNRPAPMHKEYRFVENIFEELDAPGEWFYDQSAKTIYLYPPKGVNMKTALLTLSSITDLLHVTGSTNKPAKNIAISNISFAQTARSFMLVKEPLLRSDWTIYRGGAILLDGTENIKINNCKFYNLGGNAVFVSNYNRNAVISNNYIYNVGANAIAFVGNADAVRSPAFRYELSVPWSEMDYTAGPKTKNYPQHCIASGNLIHTIGTVEKQIAGVEIDMAAHITVSHNSIYHLPRSGINIGDGCWGGHVIEFNDVFNTVLETGDHGAFNSWGRDRFWSPDRSVIDSIVAARPGIELLDVTDPIIIRNNRFQCDHGWDIDLDDGSSNYQIYNNVCLNGGLKLREGYHRTVSNNIIFNNTFHPHVWLKNSGDVFKNNVVTSPYAPILMNSWGLMIDSNFFLTKEGLIKAQAIQLDQHSNYGDAKFVSPATGNYKVQTGSAALQQGFKNFDQSVGVTAEALKKLVAKPLMLPLLTKLDETKGVEVDWLGGTFKNIETPGERSAAGLHNNNGALLVQAPVGSLVAKSNLQKGDVIVKMGDSDINTLSDLLKTYQSIKWMGQSGVTVMRNQGKVTLNVSFK